jgi:nitroreductase
VKDLCATCKRVSDAQVTASEEFESYVMDFLHVVENRHAVRQYRTTQVDKALIKRLINTAVLAPSAMNLQPWSFVVITGVTRINDYAQRAKEHFIATSGAAPTQLSAMVNDKNFSMFYHAPALLLVLALSDDGQACEDCCLAAQTLMLAARDHDLGTCWVGLARSWLNLPETKAELGIATTRHVVAPIVLGYPLEWPEAHGRRAPEILWVEA